MVDRMKAEIVLLPGDGIGVEVIAEARKVLESIALEFNHEFTFSEHLIGGCAIDEAGDPLPEKSLTASHKADAVLLGAVGGPKWDDPLAPVRPEQGLLRLRKELGLFANLRPIRTYTALSNSSPLRPERVAGVDILIVRELTGGLYFGEPRMRQQVDGITFAIDTLEYSELEIRRVLRVAFQLAAERRGIVTSVDKANVLETSRLWRQIADEISSEFPDVRLEHQLVDSCAMRLIQDAQSFDVLVTENMFGDILSDEASVLAGSLGLLPSASLGEGHRGVYEPVHGSAPDLSGKNIANPVAAILSAAMLLRHSLNLQVEAQAIEWAVQTTLEKGARTADFGDGEALSTASMGEAVRDRLSQRIGTFDGEVSL
jgi:3-isopropylmalate dehydrogenase